MFPSKLENDNFRGKNDYLLNSINLFLERRLYFSSHTASGNSVTDLHDTITHISLGGPQTYLRGPQRKAAEVHAKNNYKPLQSQGWRPRGSLGTPKVTDQARILHQICRSQSAPNHQALLFQRHKVPLLSSHSGDHDNHGHFPDSWFE